MDSAYGYFEETMLQLENSLKGISLQSMDLLIQDCLNALRNGHKIIASGLGKNVPICEKFEGTMLSAGLDAQFLHTNSAVHGDIGMVKSGDLVIVLTKSGSTTESIYLVDLLKKRKDVVIWLITCSETGSLAQTLDRKLVIPLEHEGDPWNIMPNNSTTLNLIVLQQLAMQLIKHMSVTLSDFKENHPGGAIGAKLQEEV